VPNSLRSQLLASLSSWAVTLILWGVCPQSINLHNIIAAVYITFSSIIQECNHSNDVGAGNYLACCKTCCGKTWIVFSLRPIVNVNLGWHHVFPYILVTKVLFFYTDICLTFELLKKIDI
jgi:hypothetical protein